MVINFQCPHNHKMYIKDRTIKLPAPLPPHNNSLICFVMKIYFNIYCNGFFGLFAFWNLILIYWVLCPDTPLQHKQLEIHYGVLGEPFSAFRRAQKSFWCFLMRRFVCIANISEFFHVKNIFGWLRPLHTQAFLSLVDMQHIMKIIYVLSPSEYLCWRHT